ncbi:unnamed protein product, partial [Anisakis simplex]|uniref:Calpain_III domain-containing protein n=1 Tax=Anisakis simplex TaxID=6269 RepID=A0A0M3JI21_ANISI
MFCEFIPPRPLQFTFSDTFAQNPQYLIHLSTSDPDDDCDRCTVIVAVMQKYRRELQCTGIENASIGFAVYNADGTSGRLDED